MGLFSILLIPIMTCLTTTRSTLGDFLKTPFFRIHSFLLPRKSNWYLARRQWYGSYRCATKPSCYASPMLSFIMEREFKRLCYRGPLYRVSILANLPLLQL